jgi:CBS domain-containing protein
LVNEAGGLVGIVTRGDLVRVLAREDDREVSLLEAGSANPIVTYPDELLEEAVEKMVRHDIGRLPVVERGNRTHLLGYFGRSGIAAGWRFLFEEEQVQDTGWLSRPLQRWTSAPTTGKQ